MLTPRLFCSSISFVDRHRGRHRARLRRRVVQHRVVRHDTPLARHSSVALSANCENVQLFEVEAEAGQVRLLQRHEERVVEVPAVDRLTTWLCWTPASVFIARVLRVRVRRRPRIRRLQRVAGRSLFSVFGESTSRSTHVPAAAVAACTSAVAGLPSPACRRRSSRSCSGSSPCDVSHVMSAGVERAG